MGSSVVFIDTNVLVYAIRPDDPNCDKAARAKHFLSECAKNKVHICIPAIVAAEFLFGCDSSFEETGKRLQENFCIIPFDFEAAIEFRQVVSKQRQRMKPGATQPVNSNREKRFRDCLIIATALAHKADELISFDQDLVTLAQALGIQAREPPP